MFYVLNYIYLRQITNTNLNTMAVKSLNVEGYCTVCKRFDITMWKRNFVINN